MDIHTETAIYRTEEKVAKMACLYEKGEQVYLYDSCLNLATESRGSSGAQLNHNGQA